MQNLPKPRTTENKRKPFLIIKFNCTHRKSTIHWGNKHYPIGNQLERVNIDHNIKIKNFKCRNQSTNYISLSSSFSSVPSSQNLPSQTFGSN